LKRRRLWLKLKESSRRSLNRSVWRKRPRRELKKRRDVD
jgi:hypothetical protein